MLATFAAKAVRSGRRVCGQLKAKDVLSERAQERHGFCVGKLPDCSTLNTNPLAEAQADTPDTDPSELAQATLDFSAWRRTRSRRDKKLLHDMMLGERTQVLARKYRLSQSRVSQLRSDFRTDYTRYIEGELAATA